MLSHFISVFQFLRLPSDNFSICFNPFSTYIVGWLAGIELLISWEKKKERKKKMARYRKKSQKNASIAKEVIILHFLCFQR